jgi:prepilin-type processing-associated H-X9-DG protein
LKQLGLGVMQYTQDYDESYPRATLNAVGSWRQIIQPYVKSTELFRCPSNTRNNDTADAATSQHPLIKASYVANPRVLIPDWAGGQLALSAVNSPSTKIMITEGNWDNIYMYSNWHTAGNQANVVNAGFAGHLGTAVYLFADGHVKSMRPAKTMTGTNMWGQFEDNTTSGDCANRSPVWQDWYRRGINCDEVSPGAQANIAAFDKANN